MCCKNCGNTLAENALVCDRCGAPTGVQTNYEYGERVLSKKEYFKSRLLSDKSKNMKTANWVLFGVFTAVISFFILICTFCAVLMPVITSNLDVSGGIVGLINELSEMSGTELYSESDMKQFELLDKELESVGMTLKSLLSLLPIVFGIMAVVFIGAFVVLLIAVKNKNTCQQQE